MQTQCFKGLHQLKVSIIVPTQGFRSTKVMPCTSSKFQRLAQAFETLRYFYYVWIAIILLYYPVCSLTLSHALCNVVFVLSVCDMGTDSIDTVRRPSQLKVWPFQKEQLLFFLFTGFTTALCIGEIPKCLVLTGVHESVLLIDHYKHYEVLIDLQREPSNLSYVTCPLAMVLETALGWDLLYWKSR